MWLFPEFPWGGRKMKTSRTEAAEARQRIVRAAADRFRRDGIAETGLAGFVPIVCGSAMIGALTMSRLVSYLQKRRGSRLVSVLDELGQLSAFPEGWFASVLADVGSLQVGYAYKSKWYSKEGVRLLRGSNIAPGRVTWDDEVRLPTNLAADFTDPEYR